MEKAIEFYLIICGITVLFLLLCYTNSNDSLKPPIRQNDFERGSTNKYSIISNVNLGEIRGIQIGHNSRLFGSGWYLEQIVVEDLALPSDQKQVFSFTSFCIWNARATYRLGILLNVNVG